MSHKYDALYCISGPNWMASLGIGIDGIVNWTAPRLNVMIGWQYERVSDTVRRNNWTIARIGGYDSGALMGGDVNMETMVVDISHWQADPIDWDAVRDSGVVGVIHKATQGKSYVDPKWRDRCQEAMLAGLEIASYHFLEAGDIDAQMQHYVRTIDTFFPSGSRVCLDHEPAGNGTNASLKELEQAVTWLKERRPDLQICIYSGHTIKEQLDNTRSEILAATSLWIADWTSGDQPRWPQATWPAWSLWQYTDSFACPGFNAPVDGDRWNGSKGNLKKWFGPVTDVLQPEPDEKQRVVILAPPGVEIEVRQVDES